MISGWRYRLGSVAGTAVVTALIVLVANQPAVQYAVTAHVPPFDRLSPAVLAGKELALVLAVIVGTVLCCLTPFYKPRSRRILDTITLAQKRGLTAILAIATVGYFVRSVPLPRSTLAITAVLLSVALPAWLLAIRTQPVNPQRAIVLGDDPDQIERVIDIADLPIVGYLAPTTAVEPHSGRASPALSTDGGVVRGVERLGGLSRLEDALIERDIDTVILAFTSTDRGEFFGALDTCYEHDVSVKVHREHADSVLLAEGGTGELVTVDLEPWDWQDHLVKRAFDVGFAAIGLLAAAPLFVTIALVIKLEGSGPVFYTQQRTAWFGGTFEVRKFRTMPPESESTMPIDDDNGDVRPIGRFLRRTHLDELPQLLSILNGDMSVVGPRAAWTHEEPLLEEEATEWRKRWFVKPGLTGLAQINEVTSADPRAKLRYDLEYIRNRSFWYDVKIVIRQVWMVLGDVWITVSRRDSEADRPTSSSNTESRR